MEILVPQVQMMFFIKSSVLVPFFSKKKIICIGERGKSKDANGKQTWKFKSSQD